MHFRDSPDSVSGLGIPGNLWFCRFAITYLQTSLSKLQVIPMGDKIFYATASGRLQMNEIHKQIHASQNIHEKMHAR